MIHLLDTPPGELELWLHQQNAPKFRGAQIRKWIFQNRVDDFEGMTNLPKNLRTALAEHYRLWTTEIVKHSRACDGTEKLLLQLEDGGRVECVLLRDGERRSICVSSQVGCAMGCVFCASGLDGVDRNLTAGEIIEQALRLQHLLPEQERLSHIVMMGMGEPLANLENVVAALAQASSTEGFGISVRRITISTVGLPKQIDRLIQMGAKYNLAVSLHAPNDELRTKIVPTNEKIGLNEIVAAADRYFEASGRRLTYEYVLLAGINDQPQHARQLATVLRGRPALLNIIPYNPVAGLPYNTPSTAAQQQFRRILESSGLTLQFRQRKGDEISAACGQLRRISKTDRLDLAQQ